MHQRTTLLVICLVALVHGTPPPGYKPKPEEPDPNPPKYEYGYKIQDEKGLQQGKMETRDGIYALGRYYVKGSSSSQNVDYLADDWGYHPYVQYSNVGPHSKASAQIALGKEAITAFQRNNNGDPPLTLNPTPNSPSATVATPSIRDPKQNIQPQATNEYQIQQSQQQPQEGILQEQIPQQQKEEIRQEPGTLDPQDPPENLPNQQLEDVEPQQEAQQSAQQLQQQQLGQQQRVAQEEDRAREQQLEQQQLEQQQFAQQQQQQISEEQKLNREQQLSQQQAVAEHKLAREQQLAQEEKHQAQEEQKQNIQKQEELSNQQLAEQILQQQLPLQTQNNDFLKLNQVTYNDQNINNQPLISQDGNLLSGQGHLSDAQGVQLVYMPQQIEGNLEGLFQQISSAQGNSQQPVQPLIIMQSQPFGNNVVLVDQNGNGIIQDGHAQLGQQYSNYQGNQHASASFTSDNFQHSLVDNNGQTPLALPLVYQQQTQINNAAEQTQQVNEQGTEQSQVDGLDGSGIKETAALFDSGTDMSKEDIHVENKLTQLSGSYGSKILENQNTKPSKLIESTKNLITELDVLNINDAAKFESSTPATNTINHESVSISESSSSQTNVHQMFVSSTTSATLLEHESAVTPLSLISNPIVVADYNAANVETSEEQRESYSQKSLSQEIVVTPRPDIKFLAPITAGVQLQNIDKQPPQPKQNILVEIQKSVPYYVGKYEFLESADYNQNSQEGILQNLKLGGALIDFPVNEQISTILKTSILEENKEENKAVLTNTLDQQGEQGTIQQVEVSSSETDELPKQIVTEKPVLTKYVEKPYPVPYAVEKVVEKYINRPYPVHVPVHIPVEVPVTVERKVPVPYPVEKIIDRPVPVPQPYPYPVEKIVEKKVPFEVTKYVDRPYPVHVHIPQPYPVEKIVEKVVNKPYAVPVQVPLQYQLVVPHQVPHYQYPQLPIPQAYYLPADEKQHPNNINSGKVRQYYYSNPYVYVNSYQSIQKNVKNQHQAGQENRVHLSYTTTPVKKQQQQQQQQQQHQQQQQQQQPQYVITPQHYNTQQQYISWEVPGVNCKPLEQNQYIGLLPPKVPNAVSNKRQAKSIDAPRMEYGFLPPLIPSMEIDENGRPLKHSS